jgi:Ca-activated chloride channel family protein
MFKKFLLGALLALVAAPVFAQGIVIIIDDGPPVERRRRPVRPQFSPIEIRSHCVESTVDNQGATTVVTQTFYNPNRTQMQGEYLFPLPEEAAINGFEMTMNGKMVKGELLEATKARGIYENIVRQYLDPGLMEYAGRGLFKASVFPILPLQELSIRFTYTELLKYDSGLVRFRYPLRTKNFCQLPVQNLSVKVTIKNEQALQAIYSPTHSCEIIRKGDKEAVVGFETKNNQPAADFELFYGFAGEAVAANVMSFREGSEAGYFLALLTPKIKLADDEILPKDVIYVIDTSGSMLDDGKIIQAKKALKLCVNALNEKDRFGLVTFSTESKKWRDALEYASKDNKDAASGYIEKLEAMGGTNISGALKDGISLAKTKDEVKRPTYIVFLTDGLPTVEQTNVKELVKQANEQRETHMRLFTFGVGYDVNTWLLDTLAEQNRGQREYVKPKEDIEVKVGGFYGKIASPVLADVKLKIDGAEITDMQPKLLPDLFAGGQLSVLGRYVKPGKHQVILEGVVNGQKRVYEYTQEFVENNNTKNYLPRMWAVRRVGFLLDQINLAGFSKELKDEIVALGTKFGIVTPYTSFLVVEDSQIPPPRTPGPVEDSGWRERRAVENKPQGGDGDRDGTRRSQGMGGGGRAPGASSGKDSVEESEANDDRKANDNADGAAKQDKDAVKKVEEKARGGGYGTKSAKRAEELKKKGYDAKVAEAVAADNVKTIGTRTFVWADGVWLESDVTNGELIEAEIVEYASDAYFKMAADKDIARVLALGTEVIFRSGKKVIRVIEAESEEASKSENKENK